MSDEFRLWIERGDVGSLRRALESDSGLANQAIRWHLNQENESDPLHYVSDSVFNGLLTNGQEGQIAELLLACGAAINGNEGRESPLIGSVSLGVARVSKVLVEAGANVDTANKDGLSALELAKSSARKQMFELLQKHA